MAELPKPVVPSDIYDDRYYREVCMGSDDWSASGGTNIDPLYSGFLERSHFKPGEAVVDLGTGRGELPVVAVQQGASWAVGFEYAESAVKLAKQTLDAHEIGPRAAVMAADVRAIPLRDQVCDLVTMVDVVEHLAAPELARTFEEAYRILRPGGRIVIHTIPSSTVYNVTYRLQRALSPRRRRTWPADPRNEFERSMHVNEQSLRRMRRSLRAAGFRANVQLGGWIYTDFVPDDGGKRLYHRLAKLPGLQRFGIADLWGEGVRP